MMPRDRLAALFGVALLVTLLVLSFFGSGCALPLRRTCLDGWPIRILQDPQCPRGICGYTCAPDRWRVCTNEEEACPTISAKM